MVMMLISKKTLEIQLQLMLLCTMASDILDAPLCGDGIDWHARSLQQLMRSVVPSSAPQLLLHLQYPCFCSARLVIQLLNHVLHLLVS
jgi:hypothetical protein